MFVAWVERNATHVLPSHRSSWRLVPSVGASGRERALRCAPSTLRATGYGLRAIAAILPGKSDRDESEAIRYPPAGDVNRFSLMFACFDPCSGAQWARRSCCR
jgi:hypothetical protein